MAEVRASLAILAALGVALALAGLRDAEPGAAEPRADPGGLESNAALRVWAPNPDRTLPVTLGRLATASQSPAVGRAIARTSEALNRAGVDPRRDLLAPFSFLVVSLERSCPPPALLACRPAVRVLARLHGEPTPRLRHDLRTAVLAGLRATGFRGLTVRTAPSGAPAGRVTSHEETLARWRLAGGVLEVATGGLEWSTRADLVLRGAALAAAPRAGSASGAPNAGAARDSVEVEVDRRTLATLLAN